MAVGDAHGMIAGMDPELKPGRYLFCTMDATDPRAAAAMGTAWAVAREDEGLSLVLAVDDAAEIGISGEGPMARLQLNVFSALDGVGLTAAVSAALAQADIPCNMIAGFHHDHVFVPESRSAAALDLLRARAAAEAEAAR